jgi:hypothetical protein
MKPTVSPDALVAHLDNEVVLLHAGTKEYFRLNETGQAVWRLLEQGLDVDAIVERIVAEFDVAPDTAAAEIDRLLGELAQADLLVWSQ